MLFCFSNHYYSNTTIVSINQLKKSVNEQGKIDSNTTIVSINLNSLNQCKGLSGYSNTTIVSINPMEMSWGEEGELIFKYNY